ncbi:MAG: iron-containing alcohol dehydrogenase [Firmicutes bacterium]|nr:iron-containing alcohol dehydrogenase [Bacillota bacterium]
MGKDSKFGNAATQTKISLSVGCVQDLKVNKFKNVLVLTGSKNSPQVFVAYVAPLIKTKYHVYSGIGSNPTASDIYEITNFARSKKIDCILSVGGGSVADTGKLVCLLLGQGGLLHEYVVGGTLGPLAIMPNPMHHITIPTICGTGAEVSATASFVLNNKSVSIISPFLAPKETFIDPNLMRGAPGKIWSAVGFECFASALEAYVSTYATTASDVFCLEAFKGYLSVCFKLLKDPSNVKLIETFAYASLNSLVASNLASRGAVNALGQVISANLGIQNGVALAMVCGAVCKHNYSANKSKYNTVKAMLGAEKAANIKTVINELLDKLELTRPKLGARLTDKLAYSMAIESINPAMRGNPKGFTVDEAYEIFCSLK